MGSSLRPSEPIMLVKPSLSSLFAPRLSRANAQAQQPRFISTSRACSLPSSDSSSSSSSLSRRQFVSQTATLSLSISLAATTGLYEQPAKSEEALSAWERVYIPVDPGVVLLDIAFVPDDLNHGFLLGTRQTLLETKDGGKTWAPRSIPSAEEEDFNYRFNSISFKGKEGWIVGKPAILLHTSDAGESWERIPLSSQLPGDMAFWQPHNRAVARRIQNMGWRADGGLWLLVRGGGLFLSKGTGITEEFEEVPVQSRGFGILDVGYRSQDEAWAAGGSGVLLKTTNGGKTWIREKAADNIAANLYSVKFINEKKGFVLGNDGVLLQYLG
ncbi:hypothetical protein CUMW_100360 [Citrus unshiu]|nr:hypothetical protein CUMW_100360 [Citrus unshiu]